MRQEDEEMKKKIGCQGFNIISYHNAKSNTSPFEIKIKWFKLRKIMRSMVYNQRY